ncbi:hypothetical protein Hden_3295 [Hyphomicrobium denitrificans ATCC 51888]|uniref:Uncharacterized protein n=1 Tax=Hyphomicrobium denitrificans (strain ATCC 51888 / DSM 1869 / NCIMB 11706 / TK 0415) TaxID=582899 RepID=D8JWY0_HYPDA|nr:hypothetical protein [Hyphomicrobium denitrificans]ADJ25088.1 hypothetical protein Hden_3295 [Hyphomicrobium denitrificans ATCC 51888]
MTASSQKKDPIEAEANASAAEAARDVRAEILEKSKDATTSKAAVSKLKKAEKDATTDARKKWYDFEVNVWITNFNSIEFGPWKRERNRGKSRQFTTDMDIFAEIIENGTRTGVLGYRKEIWKDASGMDKRLVFKLFSDTLNWKASMDMMLGRSIQQTLGARGVPVTTYSINTSEDDYLVYLERSANKWPLLPENFSFFLMEGGEPKFYRFRRDFINLGGDYTLINQHDEHVGHIDGAILTIGGRWRCKVRGDHADPRLIQVMKLFTGMIVFNRQARRHVKALAHDIRDGRIKPNIQRQEADLYMNPRRIR